MNAARTDRSISTLDSFDHRYNRSHFVSNSIWERNLFQFFIKPKLHIGSIRFEDEPHRGHTILRRYYKVVIENNGKSVAQNCEATVNLIPERSNAPVLPSPYEKTLVWDNKSTSRRINARGKALVYLVFTQNSWNTVKQHTLVERSFVPIPADQLIVGKIATPNSLNDESMTVINFQEDALRKGDNYLNFHVQSEDGYSDDAVFKIRVGTDWRSIEIERA